MIRAFALRCSRMKKSTPTPADLCELAREAKALVAMASGVRDDLQRIGLQRVSGHRDRDHTSVLQFGVGLADGRVRHGC